MLDYFFSCLFRLLYLFIYFSFLFIYRFFFVLVLRSEFFYYFFFLFVFLVYIIKYFHFKIFYYWLYLFILNLLVFLFGLKIFSLLFLVYLLDYLLIYWGTFLNFFLSWKGCYKWRIFRLEADFSFGNPAVVPDLRRGAFFRSVTLSPYYSLPLLESVSRLYRVNHWLWSPIDLLDKRFYVPTVKNLRFFSLGARDFSVYADSLFYKTKVVFKKESKFLKENLFFFDGIRYDNNSFSFLNYQVSPTINTVDFFSLKEKPRVYTCKPFFMSFKNFSENQYQGFEKFYLKDKLFLADSFDII